MKKIVSIQDISCYGQCSLTVALPILSAHGIETAILPSAILSTHTGGFKDFTCLDLTDEMPKIIRHWISEHISFDAIYTGYIGDYRQFEIIKDAKKSLSPNGLLLVDPAMADNGKLYTALDYNIVEGMRSIISHADLVLPNLTELAFLLDIEYKEKYTRKEIHSLLSKLCELGAKSAVITGVSFDDDKLGAVCLNQENNEINEYFTERIPQNFHGTGDVFSSILIANYLNGASMGESIKNACEFVVSSIKHTLNFPEHNYGVMFEDLLLNRQTTDL